MNGYLNPRSDRGVSLIQRGPMNKQLEKEDENQETVIASSVGVERV
jgi:hypothetical protein